MFMSHIFIISPIIENVFFLERIIENVETLKLVHVAFVTETQVFINPKRIITCKMGKHIILITV